MARSYPTWKKTTWRAVRVFVVAFLAQFGVNLALFSDPEYVKTLTISAVAAGVSAVTKLLREGRSYEDLVHKLPL